MSQATAPRDERHRPSAVPFVGRQDELDVLVSAPTHSPSLVLVAGDAGIGKSRLVTEAAAVWRDHATGLTGHCHRLREPFPLGPIAGALAQAGGVIAGRVGPRGNNEANDRPPNGVAADTGHARVPGPQLELPGITGVLRTVIPELIDVLPPMPPQDDDRLVRQHQVFRGLSELLRALGDAVMVIEDAQWADPQTIEFLHFLLTDPPPGLTVVLTYRSSEADSDVMALGGGAGQDVEVMRVALDPWDVATTGELAAAMLELDTVSDEFATYLCTKAGGNPFAVKELMLLLQERGAVRLQDGHWIRPAIEDLDVPDGIRESVLERLGRLDDTARTVVETMAVLQRPTPARVVEDAARVAADVFGEAAQQGLDAGLLVEQDGGLDMVHDLAGQSVREGLSAVRLTDVHGAIADALDALDEPPLAQLAHHLRGAGRTERWPAVAEAAGVQAQQAEDDEAAVDLFELVLREVDLDDEAMCRVAFNLAVSARVASGAVRVLPLLLAVAESDSDIPPADRAELQLLLGDICWNVNHKAQAQMFRNAAAECSALPTHRRLAARLVASQNPLLADRPAHEFRESVDRVTAERAQLSDSEVPTLLDAGLARVQIRVGTKVTLRNWLGEDSELVSRESLGGCLSVAGNAASAGYVAMAERLAGRCRDLDHVPYFRAARDETMLRVDYCRGRWDGLQNRIGALWGDPYLPPTSRHGLWSTQSAVALAVGGPTEELTARLDEYIGGLVSDRMLEDLSLVLGVRARIAVAQNMHDEVPGWLLFQDAVAREVVMPFMYWALPDMCASLAAAGDHDTAQWLVDQFDHAAIDAVMPLAPSTLSHARGHVATLTNSLAEASQAFLDAADAYAEMSMPYHEAQARESAARVLLPVGDEAGRDALRKAIVCYDELGARWDLDRSKGLARRHEMVDPARSRTGPKGYGDDMSPREREVAALAATGMTNPEIAEHLFLSVHTVRKHVSAVLRKLDVQRRHEIAAALDRDPSHG